MNTIVVTVDRTNTVTVQKHTPSLTSVTQTSTVATIASPTPTVTTVERTSPDVDLILAGQQGPRGPQGPAGPAGAAVMDRLANATLGGHRIVRSVGMDLVDYASAGDPSHGDDTLGITLQAANIGGPIQVQRGGAVTFNGWAWTPGEPVFLGASGQLTQAPAETGFVQVIGHAESPTTVFLDIQSPIYFD